MRAALWLSSLGMVWGYTCAVLWARVPCDRVKCGVSVIRVGGLSSGPFYISYCSSRPISHGQKLLTSHAGSALWAEDATGSFLLHPSLACLSQAPLYA